MLSIYICDDEEIIRKQIENDVKCYFMDYPSEYEITLFDNGRSLLRKIREGKFDVLFLDIDLGDSHGIKIAKIIRQINKKVKIIFITSYKNYKSEAFSVRAFGYIDKPATREQIYKQLRDIQKYAEAENMVKFLKFETLNGVLNIEIKDIIYFENSNRKIKIVTFNNVFYMKQKISTLTIELEKFNFYCPHVSFLVNLDYVVDIKNYIVYLINDIQIPLSQRKAAAFQKAMNNYFEQTINICKDGKNV